MKVKNNTFFLTFGQKSPFRHNWVRVEASDRNQAVEMVNHIFGPQWANLYPKNEFKSDYFPKGEVGEVIK